VPDSINVLLTRRSAPLVDLSGRPPASAILRPRSCLLLRHALVRGQASSRNDRPELGIRRSAAIRPRSRTSWRTLARAPRVNLATGAQVESAEKSLNFVLGRGSERSGDLCARVAFHQKFSVVLSQEFGPFRSVLQPRREGGTEFSVPSKIPFGSSDHRTRLNRRAVIACCGFAPQPAIQARRATNPSVSEFVR
jgi:hypothetical protein